MYKKLSTLVLAAVLSLSVVGCNNEEEAEYQEPQSQQEEVQQEEVQEKEVQEKEVQEKEVQEKETVDEDLTEEYEEKISKQDQLELAKTTIEIMAKENFDSSVRYDVYVDEESNTVCLRCHITEQECLQGIISGDYAETTNIAIENSRIGKETFTKAGLDVNYSVMLMDLDKDEVWFGAINGTVLFDCTK